MKSAVIGAGIAGTSHLLDLVSSSEFDVVAVGASRMETAQEAASTFGITAAYASVPGLLAAHAPEAVVIAVPPHASPGILRTCLEHGALVVIDKPAAADGSALRTVIGHAGPAAGRAVVAYNRRYQGHVARARDLIRAGALGSLTAVECRWTGPFTRRYTSGATYRRAVAPGHAVLLDTVCHVIDTVVILGVRALVVDEARLTALPSGAEVAAEIRLAAGDPRIPVAISVQDHGEDDQWRITIRGDRGILELDRHKLTGVCEGCRVDEAASSERPVDDLLRLADGNSPLGATLDEAAQVLDIIDRIRAVAVQARRPWIRPRAKALGRLNGAC
jgi:predicted dehydrogenase